MANMSYCKYENTLSDLRDCYETMDDEPGNETEKKCKAKLIELCREIAENYGGD